MKSEKQKTKNNSKKILKLIKIVTISLGIILVSMIGFFGIYKQSKNTMNNVLKEYSYSMALNGARTIELDVNKETKEVIKDSEGNEVESATDEEISKNGYTKEQVSNNAEEILTEANYNKTKEILEKRLKNLNVEEYNISLNNQNGNIILEIPEDSNTDSVVANLTTIGKFEIIDTQTKEVLLNNDDVKSSEVLYNTSTSGTNVYLQITFNKNGKNKLEEITKKYVKVENNTTDNTTAENSTEEENTENNTTNTTTEETVTTNQITMKINDEEIMTTTFDTPITTGKIQLSVGSATTDTTTLNGYITQAQSIATSLDSGKLPIQYDINKNEYILSDVSQQSIGYAVIVIAILAVIGIIVLIVKYKVNGLLAGIAYIGFSAIYLLLVRYTNVVISIESIFGIVAMLVLNYIFTIMILKNMKNGEKKPLLNAYAKFFNRILPICIMIIVFCFIKWIPISSFGMITFWGLVVIAIYNAIITQSLLKIEKEDK